MTDKEKLEVMIELIIHRNANIDNGIVTLPTGELLRAAQELRDFVLQKINEARKNEREKVIEIIEELSSATIVQDSSRQNYAIAISCLKEKWEDSNDNK
jgi:hypothetical protein